MIATTKPTLSENKLLHPVHEQLRTWLENPENLLINPLQSITKEPLETKLLNNLVQFHKSDREVTKLDEGEYEKLKPLERLKAMEKAAMNHGLGYLNAIWEHIKLFFDNNKESKLLVKSELLNTVKILGQKLQGLSIQKMLNDLSSKLILEFKKQLVRNGDISETEFDQVLASSYSKPMRAYL